jgi:two-component system, NarL family, response regulator DevR
MLASPWAKGVCDAADAAAVGGINVMQTPRRVLVVVHHNAFREALAMRLNQEEDLEVAWQAGSMTDTRDVHLDGVDVALVDPLLPDGDGLELIREVSVANPSAVALVLSHKLDPALYQQALGAGAVQVLATNATLDEVIDALRGSATADEEEE